jgi:hypothetical protein
VTNCTVAQRSAEKTTEKDSTAYPAVTEKKNHRDLKQRLSKTPTQAAENRSERLEPNQKPRTERKKIAGKNLAIGL